MRNFTPLPIGQSRLFNKADGAYVAHSTWLPTCLTSSSLHTSQPRSTANARVCSASSWSPIP